MNDTAFCLKQARIIAGPKATLAVTQETDGDHIEVTVRGRKESFSVRLLALQYERYGIATGDAMFRDAMGTSGLVIVS